MSDLKVLRDACIKIVGHWRCEQIEQDYIFDFNDKMLGMNKLTVIHTNSNHTFDTEYGIAIDISRGIEIDKTNLYFDIGRWERKRYYSILTLTKDMLVIEEFNMDLTGRRGSPLIYKRVIDTTQTDEILKGLSSTDPQL